MNRKLPKLPLIIIAVGLIIGLCALSSSLLFGSGLAFWFIRDEESVVEATPRLIRRVEALASPTPTSTAITLLVLQSPPTDTPQPLPSPTPLPTSTPAPSATNTPTPLPTNTPPPPPPDTPTPLPTDTPTPAPPDYAFTIKESATFGTNHLSFDVYIAVVNDDNRPLSDYRVIGRHSSGLEIVSSPSAGDWTSNSGAMHYKAGNIKYEAPNSPGGVWTLQLVDGSNTPMAPPIEFPFDPSSPNWYFLIYERR